MGNKRKELSKQTLGIPVIAIGVPTVVDAVSIASDTIDLLLKHLGREMKEGNQPARALAPASLVFGKKKVDGRRFTERIGSFYFLGMVGMLNEEENGS